jgi:hypothetical protein
MTPFIRLQISIVKNFGHSSKEACFSSVELYSSSSNLLVRCSSSSVEYMRLDVYLGHP